MPVSRRRRRRSSQSGRQAEMVINPSRPKPNYWYIGASAIIAFLVIAGFVVGGISFRGSDDGVGSSDEYVEGVGEQHVIMPTRIHVSEDQNVDYSTTPPTSGDHWDWWARCGFYEDGLPDERIVHNLEHGNIVVSYNLQEGPALEQLKDFMDSFELAPSWAVTRYYDKVPEGTIALSAWGVLDTMQSVDEDRIEDFFRTYAGTLGPEFPNGAPCTTSGVME
ncbi:MAG: DUF3105 domain-containing protein [Chloroflexi bacterium]|nr:DUF3105 domain-containing protein [Chloroflexota bacterium]